MPISIGQGALSRLPSTPPLTPPLHVDHDSTIASKQFSGDFCIRKEERGEQETASRDHDDDSVVTASTASVSSDDTNDDDDDFGRTVYFAAPLVTEEWTREYTPKDAITDLYYSTQDTTRFRHEYRLERKMLSDLELSDVEVVPDTELFTDSTDNKCQTQGRRQISRVVVIHNDKLQTFFNADEAVVPSAGIAALAPKKNDDVPDNDNFFDSDSFWSGAVTWF